MNSEKLLKRTERTLQAMAEEANRLTPKQQGLLRLLYNTPSPAQPGREIAAHSKLRSD